MRSTLKKFRVMFEATADKPSPAAERQMAEHELEPQIEVPLAADADAGQSPYSHGRHAGPEQGHRKTSP